jgi:DNA-binding LacI/PurR family transcriptional regulator
MSAPPLTSIDVNSFQLGIEAASQIINHIENPNLMATKIIVPHQLVERDSCREI